MDIPTIKTKRLILRPFNEADVDPLHRILNEKDILRYYPNPDPPERERVQRLISRQLTHWEEHNLGWWALQPYAHSELIGWCGLQFLPETGETEVGYLLSHAFWGQGLTTEAAHVSLKYGFDELKLEQIIALVHPENKASIRVIEKLGLPFVDLNRYFDMDVYRYRIERSAFYKEM